MNGAKSIKRAELLEREQSHDLMLVASGRGSLTKMLPRDLARSPYAQPRRLQTGALYQGLVFPDSLGVIYKISPGNGEIFQIPSQLLGATFAASFSRAFRGRRSMRLRYMRYEDDPKKFEATVLDLLRQHAPPIYERVNPKEFGVHDPVE